MNTIKTLILLIAMNGAVDAQTQSMPESNGKAHHFFVADHQMNGQNDVDYFKKILTGGGLYALLLAMNTEVPDVAKSLEYVAIFKKLNVTNRILSQILIELKKNNQLLSLNRRNEEITMDG
ncbi:hypothetical protein Lsan_0650 [Legionella santicrucis]|uniref:Uncharacterized protein n=1 Tax=Legionella santicrucis TaxID=45074 RepID=A0A0W0ZB76_9GAMM|nr:hypothetical protein [Legionella santicrucis]KTD66218.1 hypothetical protein Lsan_0650 [Legionella santicrucis]